MKRIILVLLVAACFGQNGLHDFAPSLGRGLNVNVVGGVAAISTVPTAIAGTSVGVAANTTTYIYVDLSAAIISSNTSGFTSTEYPVATVVTNSTQIVTLTDDRPGAYAVSGGGGSGTVSSVSNSDGTLTITPTTGAVIAALALAHANTWTGQQTFVAPILGTPASGIITNLTGTCTSCTANSASNMTGGAANDISYQTAGGASGFFTPVDSAVVITNSSGVPSESTTLPSGLSATNLTLVTPAIGTPASGVGTNITGIPAANILAGTMASGMTLVAPALGTPASGVLTNTTGYPTVHTMNFSFGTPGGSAISTGILGYATIPIGCILTGWQIEADAGTDTVKTLKVATGTAIPTLGSNSISTSGVSLATGTVLQSTTLTDFTTTTFSAKDIVAADLIATSGTGYIDFQLVLSCTQ